MTIQTDLQALSASSALIELFVLDTTNMAGGTLSYFHAGTNQLLQPVIWQGNQYNPLPIEATGFDITARGTLPRPHIRVANVNGSFSAEAREFDDLVGCKITRKRTYARYLDAVNFPGGVNPDADPNQFLPDDIWYIEQKLSEDKYIVEWELSSAFDLIGVLLPYRQVIQNSCTWVYRGPECGYLGPAMDANDQPCASNLDFCSKRLGSCKARFGNANLPFGGFPGATRRG